MIMSMTHHARAAPPRYHIYIYRGHVTSPIDHSPPRRCRSTAVMIIHRRGVVGPRGLDGNDHSPPRRYRSPAVMIIHRRGVIGPRQERSFTAAALSVNDGMAFTAAALSVLDGNDHSPPRRCRSTMGKIIHRRGVVGQRRERSFTAAALSVLDGNDHSPPRRYQSPTGMIIHRRGVIGPYYNYINHWFVPILNMPQQFDLHTCRKTKYF